MKKNVFLLAVVGAALTACSSSDDVFTGKTQQEAKYEYNFVQKFGQPAVDHTWGFGNSTRSTRAAWTGAQDNNIGVNTMANQWWKYISLPNPITKEEQAKVYNAFRNTHESNVKNPNWSRFFIQQVWTGTDVYKGTNKDGVIKEHEGWKEMNELLCGKSAESMGHINNGNAATITPQQDVQLPNPNGDSNNGIKRVLKENELPEGIMFIENGGTACFGFKNSGDSKCYANYLMLEIDGQYYVGLDWELNDDDDKVYIEADKDYTDWIIKITPGDYQKSPNWDGEAKRVFCEDLGTTDDFDFNDIVLDVVTHDNKTIITLRAAGGTLPAHIFAGSEDLGEVHELFGVPTNTMVNTRTNGSVSRPIVVLEVNGKYLAKDINIKVEGKDGVEYPLSAETGKVPYKFATDLGVDWADERQDINKKWSGFDAWVNDENNPFWK